MKNLLLSALTMVSIVAGANVAVAAPAANLTAAELAVHRVDKLILLKKVDSAFKTKLRSVEVVNLQNGGAGKPTFQIVISQEGDAGAMAPMLTIVSDESGKPLSNSVMAGKAATRPTVWTAKDPGTLIEIASHHVEHLAGSDKKIAQFIKPLKAIRIMQGTLSGKLVARVEFIANGVKEKLTMFLALDGTLISTEVK